MSMRHLAVGFVGAAFLASATLFAAADSGSSSSQSSASVNSNGSQGSNSSTVGIGGQGSQNAFATPGGFAVSGSVSGAGGLAGEGSGVNGGGSYAKGIAGTGGYAFAKSGLDEPVPSYPEPEVTVSSGGSTTQVCLLTVHDWSKWHALSFKMRRAAAQCQCPTNTAISTASKLCPAPNGTIFTAKAQ